VLHPLAAWLIGRSLQTLPLRMRQHQDNAFAVARFLEQHPAVEQVFYPGLSSHPQHELAKSQMANFSGMIAFRARNSKSLRDRFAAEAEILSYAVSLGKTKSLIVLVDTDEVQSQSFQMPPAELEKYRAAAGDGIFRLSVGLEDSADIIADLDRILGS
jgi:cystathionine beta-lyase/cystathionine gamma-synthase